MLHSSPDHCYIGWIDNYRIYCSLAQFGRSEHLYFTNTFSAREFYTEWIKITVYTLYNNISDFEHKQGFAFLPTALFHSHSEQHINNTWDQRYQLSRSIKHLCQQQRLYLLAPIPTHLSLGKRHGKGCNGSKMSVSICLLCAEITHWHWLQSLLLFMPLILNRTERFLKPWEISMLSVYGHCSVKQLPNCILNNVPEFTNLCL